jgi:HlyD family secretion protein
LDAAEGAVAQARKNLSEAVVRAPRDGAVSTIVSHAGEIVSANLPVVKMLDLQNAYVRVYLSFHSFGKVKAGQPATIETDALPGRTFPGKVIEMATEAEFTPKNVETRDQRLQQVYWVKVAIVGADRRLKPGMPARATITPANP